MMRFTNRLPEDNVNLSKTSPLQNYLKGVVVSFGALAALYFCMIALLDSLIPHISHDQERWLGEVFTASYDGGDRAPKEVKLQAMLDSLVQTAPPLTYSPTVHVEQSDMVNAYALPGGHIVVLTGLLDEVESETELAFILGHELGHIAHRDHLRGLGRAVALVTLNFVCATVLGVEVLPDTLTLFDRAVSRDRESAADRYGLDRLHATYGHVTGSLVFFERQRGEKQPLFSFGFGSTHPDPKTRIEDLKQYAAEQGYRFIH